jgi:proteasome lid subunit RPN8/RPN11
METETQELETPAAVAIEESSVPYFFTPKGETVYIANTQEQLDEITKDARANELEFYYVLGLNSPHNNEPAVMTLFQVNDNLVSQSFVPTAGSALELTPIKNMAWFKLARLPWELIQMVETFFRKIDKDLGGSEAIVVLAFDERYDVKDPAGWRVIVPVQNNSAAHCNYDPMSIVDFIPDEDYDYWRQVGTIHSHPGMSAFASHTDEKDQATFDGVHITIGWKGNLTEFHAEIQAGGQNFRADPGLVIEIPEREKKDYPEFKDWAARVKKETPLGNGPKVLGAGANKTTSAPSTPFRTPQVPSGGSSAGSSWEGIKVPDGCPPLTKSTVITNLLSDAAIKCPVCKSNLCAEEKNLRRCRTCQVFLAFPGESMTDVIKIREDQGRPVYELQFDKAKRTVAFWRRRSESDTSIEYYPPQDDNVNSPKVPGGQLHSERTPYL